MKSSTKQIKTAFRSYEEIPSGACGITACYVRVSTDSQAINGYGLETQIEALTAYCAAHRFTNVFFFIDDGYTGTNTERPAYQAMLMHLRQERLTRILVMKIDRLGRSLRDIVLFFDDEVRKHRCAFISLNPNFDTSDATGKLILMLLATFAEMDHDNIVEKTELGRRQRAMEGKWKGGGKVPYGYRYQDGALVIQPEEAERVCEVFRLYAEEQLSPAAIAELMGFSGERVVAQILRNRTYLGVLKYKGTEYPGKHPVFLDADLFQRAQEKIAARHSVHGNVTYLLSSLVYCGCCGAKMRYQQWGAPDRHKLICYSQQRAKPALIRDENCTNPRYDAEEVEAAVVHQLFQLAYRQSRADISPQAQRRQITDAFREKKKAAENALLRLYKRVALSETTDAVLEKAIAEQKEAIAHLERQLQQEIKNSETAQKAERESALLQTLPGTWDAMSLAERQTVVRELVERVELMNGEVRVYLKLAQYLNIRADSASDFDIPPSSERRRSKNGHFA